MEYSIPRLAGAADAARIADLLRAFNLEFGEPSPSVETIARRLEKMLAGDAALCVVSGDPIIAFGLVTLRPSAWSDGPAALLDELYVVPERRSQGIGSTLIQEVFAEARRRGVEDLQIPVDEADADAHRFYTRHGFPVIRPSTGDRAFLLEYDGGDEFTIR